VVPADRLDTDSVAREDLLPVEESHHPLAGQAESE
jgi:hypothetical protein